MKRLAIAVAATVSLALAGCGGDTFVLGNLFAGGWSGTWNASLANETGTLSLNVASNETVLEEGSSLYYGPIDSTGQVTGTVTDSGTMDLEVTWEEGGSMTIDGTGIVREGRFQGSFQYVYTPLVGDTRSGFASFSMNATE